MFGIYYSPRIQTQDFNDNTTGKSEAKTDLKAKGRNTCRISMLKENEKNTL